MDITKWMIKKPDKSNSPVEPVPEFGDTDCHELESVKAKKIKIDTACGARGGDDTKGKKKYKFQKDWVKNWPWVNNDAEKGMVCELCMQHTKQNSLTTGCLNFHTSTLERHATSTDHQLAVKEESMSLQFNSVNNFIIIRNY